MKTDTIESQLGSMLAERAALVSEISSLPEIRVANGLLCNSLEDEVDVTSQSDKLHEVAARESLDGILERRLAKRQTQLLEFDARLVEFSNSAISRDLGPRVRALASRLRKKVTEDLRPHFPDEVSLSRAANSSKVILDVEGLSWTINHTPSNAVDHAKGVMNSLRTVAEFEAKHP